MILISKLCSDKIFRKGMQDLRSFVVLQDQQSLLKPTKRLYTQCLKD